VDVKVITVVKDDLEGLKRTEQSIVNQSKLVSWILVTPNDNSQTYEYAQHLIHQNIVDEIILDSGGGVYSAMNQAVVQANQEDWFWFLNAGDEFAAINTYELICQSAMTTVHEWMYGGHYLGSYNGKILGEVKTPARFKPANQLFSKKYISHQSTIFRAKFLQDLGGFRSDLKVAADWDLMVRASKLDPGHRVPETLSIFYMGGLSTAARQVANKELFLIRKRYLGRKYAIKNYWWFGYRLVRNRYVRSFELRNPSMADAIRRIRLQVKNLSK